MPDIRTNTGSTTIHAGDVLVVDATPLRAHFERAYYPPHGTPWPPLTWRGVPCQKTAYDLWRLSEVVWELRPGLIIETGTAAGGTALFLADLLDHIGRGIVLTMDVQPCVTWHTRLRFWQYASLAPPICEEAARVARQVRDAGWPVLVILDSDHRAEHVAAELAVYAPLVTVGSYCLVEDGNLGDSVMPDHGPGPSVAIAEFLAAHPGEFKIDTARDPPITTNPNGYIKRIRPCTCH